MDYILTTEDSERLNLGKVLVLPPNTTRIVTSSWWCEKCQRRLLAGTHCGICKTYRNAN